MNTGVISISCLTRRYGSKHALDNVAFDVPEGAIVGLLGRNGAGKTTLMRIIAAQEFSSSGSVHLFGENPVENVGVLQRIAFVRENQLYPPTFRVRHALRAAKLFCPNWSEELSDKLLKDFDLPLDRRVRKLSRGMRAALGIVIGLSARAELTMFDEPYAGLDPVARQLFYDHLLADQANHPRTVLLSTHLIDEVAGLLERVVVLEQGRVIVDAATDDVRGSATRLKGPAHAVEQFTANRPTWDYRRITSEATVVISGVLSDNERTRARELGLALEPMSLQQFMIYAVGTAPTPLSERTQL